MALSYFFVTFPIGSAAAAVMNIVPNTMRGQATALYFFAVNLIGLGIGPSAVAWCTDYLFENESHVGYSIVVVSVGTHAAAVLAFARGLKPYRESVLRLKEWEKVIEMSESIIKLLADRQAWEYGYALMAKARAFREMGALAEAEKVIAELEGGHRGMKRMAKRLREKMKGG